MDSLTELADGVIFTFNLLFKCFHVILDFNYFLVSFLLKIVSSIISKLCLIVSLLGSAILAALEDFHAFLCDIFSGLTLTLHLLEETIEYIHELLIETVNDIKEITRDIHVFVKTILTSIVLTFEAFFVLLYDVLCLALRSLVLLLQMFPYSIILLCSTLKSALVYIGNGISSFFTSIALGIGNITIAIANFLAYTIAQVPSDAYIGLIIAGIMYGLFKCHSSGLIKFPPLFLRFCINIRWYLSRVWSVLVVLCRRMKPKRMVRKPAMLPNSHSSKQNEQDKVENVKALRQELERQIEQSQCIICQTEPKSVVLLPCKHMCLCVECSNRLFEHRSTCPLCRRRVLNPIEVYT